MQLKIAYTTYGRRWLALIQWSLLDHQLSKHHATLSRQPVTLTLLLQVFCCLIVQHHIAPLMKLLASCFWDEIFAQD